jgi:hypothetical protein
VEEFTMDSNNEDVVFRGRASNCENCIALKNHLHNLTLELESTNLIIKFLQEDANTPDDLKVVKPVKTDKSSDMKDYDIFNHKWIDHCSK